MPTNYVKWCLPCFLTSDGMYECIILRGSKNLSQAAADTITLDTARHFAGEITVNKFRDTNNRLLGVEVADLEFITSTKYTGTSDGNPVSVDLTSEKLDLFHFILSDRDMLYTLYIKRTRADATYEYLFAGDFRRADVKFNDEFIRLPTSVNEWATGTVNIRCAPLKRRLEDLTVEDFVRTLSGNDCVERGAGDTTNIAEPFYGGMRKDPNGLIFNYNALTGVFESFDGTLNSWLNKYRQVQFDYSMALNGYSVASEDDAPFPAVFWGISIYSALNKLFSHTDVNFAFDTSSYDAIAYKLGKQTWDDTVGTGIKYVSDFTADQTLADIFLNVNVVFGIDPTPRYKAVASIDTGTNVITSNLHGFADGDQVWVLCTDSTADGGSIPGGLTALTDYYIISAATNTFQLSLTEGGSAIDITSAGSNVSVTPVLWIETPNTINRKSSVLEFIKRVCYQFNFFLEFGITQSGINEGKPTVYFRQRLQAPTVTFPTNLIYLDGHEQPPGKPIVIKASFEGDETELYCPRIPVSGDEVLDLTVPWRTHPLATPDGTIYARHLTLNGKFGSLQDLNEQVQCIYERTNYNLTFTIHPYSHVLGAHLFYFKPKSSTNTVYPTCDNAPTTYDSQFFTETTFEGFNTWNLTRWGSDATSESENLLETILRISANDLLRGKYSLRRRFLGVVDGSDSSLTLKPLLEYSTRRETAVGVARDYYVDKVTLKFNAQISEFIFEEQPTTYTTLDEFPIVKKGSIGTTSMGGSQTGDSGSGTGVVVSESYVANSPQGDDRNVVQPITGDYENLTLRPYATSPTKDVLRVENSTGATLYAKINKDGEILTYKQAAIQLQPYGTSTGNTGEERFYELVANGSHYVGLKAPDSLAASNTYTLPTAYPASSGYALVATTAGVLSWASIAADLSPAVILSPASANRNRILPTADSVVGLEVEKRGSSTANLITIWDESDTPRVTIDQSFNFTVDTGNIGITTSGNVTIANGYAALTQGSIGTRVLSLISTATNDDPQENFWHGRAATTDGTTWTTLGSYATTSNTAAIVNFEALGRRTGGTGGTAGDSAGFGADYVIKNISGTVTVVGGTTRFTHRDNVNVAFRTNINGTSVEFQVKGDTNNNYSWHGFFVDKKLGS